MTQPDEDYDRLLKFRYRYDLSAIRMAKLMNMERGTLRLVEAGIWPIEGEKRERLTELEAMPEETVRGLASRLGRGGFDASETKREAMAWRWHFGLTHEEAAERLGLQVDEYRLMDASNRVRLPENVLAMMRHNRASFPPL